MEGRACDAGEDLKEGFLLLGGELSSLDLFEDNEAFGVCEIAVFRLNQQTVNGLGRDICRLTACKKK